MSVQEIEHAIEQLPPTEWAELRRWLDQFQKSPGPDAFGLFAHLQLSGDDVLEDRRAEMERDEQKWEERCGLRPK